MSSGQSKLTDANTTRPGDWGRDLFVLRTRRKDLGRSRRETIVVVFCEVAKNRGTATVIEPPAVTCSRGK